MSPGLPVQLQQMHMQLQLLPATQQVDATMSHAFCSPAANPQPMVQILCSPVSSNASQSWTPGAAVQLGPVATTQQYVVQPQLPHHQPVSAGFVLQQHWESQQQQVLPTTVFFAGVTPVADGQRLRLLFSKFGYVEDLNLFRPYNGCRTSKGCGLVVFAQHSEAAAALEALNGRFIWPGARSPMVIEWCDPNKQHKKKRAQPLTRTIFFNQAPQMQSMQQYVAHPMLAQQQLPQQPLMTTMLPGTIPMMGHDLGHMQGAYVNQRVF